MKHAFVTTLAVVFAGAIAAAQSPGLRFEVASIKPYAETPGGSRGGMCSGPDTQVAVTRFGTNGLSNDSVQSPVSPGSCRFRRATARTLIFSAYSVGRIPGGEPIVGGPPWLDTELFDVDAKADGVRPQAELEQMLQRLLAERFGLRVHRETREVDGFALTIAPRGARLAVSKSFAGSTIDTAGEITTQGVVLDRLARAVEFRLGKPIVNETGLTGVYSFTLRWTPGDGELPLIPGAPPEIQEQMKRGIDANGPSLFTALDEQLGLRLQPRKVSFEFLVIDAIERPTAN